MGKFIVEGVDLAEFIGIPYVASRHPGNVSVEEFLANPQLGANCQLLTLGVEARANYHIPASVKMDQGGRFGSEELWLDDIYTQKVVDHSEALFKFIPLVEENCRVFDILFFWPDLREAFQMPPNFKALHMGVSVSANVGYTEIQVLHNSKLYGFSRIQSVGELFRMGYDLHGIKRPILRKE